MCFFSHAQPHMTKFYTSIQGWWLQIWFYFHPYLEERIQFDEQHGWFNRQPAKLPHVSRFRVPPLNSARRVAGLGPVFHRFFFGKRHGDKLERYTRSNDLQNSMLLRNMCCFFVVDFSVAELDHELLGSIPFVWEKIGMISGQRCRKHIITIPWP